MTFRRCDHVTIALAGSILLLAVACSGKGSGSALSSADSTAESADEVGVDSDVERDAGVDSAPDVARDVGGEVSVDADADAPGTVDVPLTVISRNSAGGKGLAVMVSIGGAAPVALLVDTGSAGIHVLKDKIAGATMSTAGAAITETYVDGTELVGNEAVATVALGDAMTGPISIHVVNTVTCTSDEPSCSGSVGDDFFVAHGVVGIVGVGLSNSVDTPSVYSPIPQMPGNYASGFIIHTEGYTGAGGLLTIGLDSEKTSTFATTSLTAQETSLPNGAPAWQDAEVSVCYSLDGSSITDECAPSIFDTGATATFWNTEDLTNAELDDGALKSGSVFHATIAGVFSWNLTVGATPTAGVDLILSSPGAFNTNLGIGIFFDYDVMFDAQHGAIGFSAR